MMRRLAGGTHQWIRERQRDFYDNKKSIVGTSHITFCIALVNFIHRGIFMIGRQSNEY